VVLPPLLLATGWFANHYGWQWGMWVPGVTGLSLGLFCLGAVSDSPLEAGFRRVAQHPECRFQRDEDHAADFPGSLQRAPLVGTIAEERRSAADVVVVGSAGGRADAAPSASTQPESSPPPSSKDGNSDIKKALAEVITT